MTQFELKTLLDYCPDTGVFTWKVNKPPRAKAGEVAGYNNGSGYIKVSIHGVACYAHRLAFIWMNGESPNVVDHINGVRHDNRWVNLRSVQQKQNCSNKTFGTGVRLVRGKWEARYASKHLGYFKTKKQALQRHQTERAKCAKLDPIEVRKEIPQIICIPKRHKYTKRMFQGKSLTKWAQDLGIPQPTLYYKIFVQGIPFEKAVAVKGMTKEPE
jgi:hypothetical protein